MYMYMYLVVANGNSHFLGRLWGVAGSMEDPHCREGQLWAGPGQRSVPGEGEGEREGRIEGVRE